MSGPGSRWYKSGTMLPRPVLWSFLLLLGACATVADDASTAPAADAAKAAAGNTGPEKADPEKAKELAKELRSKQRERRDALAEHEATTIANQVAVMSAEAGLRRARAELDEARDELATFEREVRPRELEDRRIGLDSSTYRADHAKDELGELTKMYEEDEFAKTTKELVLKRGRRDLELADRGLAVAKLEFEHFANRELPKRLRELQRKFADAELELAKAELERKKLDLEQALAAQKHGDRLADLDEAIAELEQKLQKLAKGAA